MRGGGESLVEDVVNQVLELKPDPLLTPFVEIFGGLVLPNQEPG